MRCLDHTRGRYGTFTIRCVVLTYPPESTTIALLARLSGLMEPLREFVKTKAVWGTCAGAVLLSQAVSNPKKGGQELLGGVSVTTMRNGWGSQVTSSSSRPPFCLGITKYSIDFYMRTQVESFEAPLEVSGLQDANIPFMGIFIRAPVRSITFSVASLCSGTSRCPLKGYYGTPSSAARTSYRDHFSHSRFFTPTSHTRWRPNPDGGRTPSRSTPFDNFPP